MEKKKYYVSVQARTILENQGDAAYELCINAVPEDIDALFELFEDHEIADEMTFLRTHTPAVPYHHDKENDRTDRNLKEIYQALYTMGTDETKQHIQAMGILNNEIGR